MNEPSQAPARHTIAVGSGKGGVGKSTVSLNLALALRRSGSRVGLLDADFYGPNTPLMVGLKREQWQGDWELAGRRKQTPLAPIERYGVQIMSAGFIIAEDQPLILDGHTVPFLLRQLIARPGHGAVCRSRSGTARTGRTLMVAAALGARSMPKPRCAGMRGG